MTDEPHKIDLTPIGLPGEWVAVRPQRTAGMKWQVLDAIKDGNDAYYSRMAELYVTGWSPGVSAAPFSLGAFRNLNEHVATYVLEMASEHYQSQRRTPAEGEASSSG